MRDRFFKIFAGILPSLIMEILVVLIFFVVFKVSGTDMEYFYMAFNIVLFVNMIFCGLYFLFLDRKQSLYEEMDTLKEEYSSYVEMSKERENSIKSYFMMWVHQIKTPITAVNLMLSEDKIEENRDRIKIQMHHIESYTNMALTFIKMMDKNKDMYIERASVDRIITEVLKKYSTLFIYYGVKLAYSPVEAFVSTDPKWASIMLEQVVSNSLKYTQGVKDPKISIYFDREKNALVVEDNGIGIREDDLPRIFDRGYSGFNGSYNQKSSGIGLYLVKDISKKLSVDIHVESKTGEGTRFFMIFPDSIDDL